MLLVPGLTEEWLAIAPLRTGNKPVYNCCLVGAHGSRRVGMGEDDTLAGELVYVRRSSSLLP